MMAVIRRNFGYKLVSVLIALMLYFIANNQQNPRTSNEVYILPEVVGLPDDEVVRTAPAGFTAIVAGSTPIVNAYKLQTIKATVDVWSARVGPNKLPIAYKVPSTGDIDISGGPSYAEVTLEHKQRQQWTVDVINLNDPPPGFEYVEPPRTKVKVTGLPSEVSRVARVIAPIPKTIGAGEIDETVSLVAQTESQQTVDTVQIEPARLEVRIALKPSSSSKMLILSPVLKGTPAPGYEVYGYSFDPPVLNVTGTRENLATRSSLGISVDVDGLTKSEDTTVPIELPAGLALQQSQKVTVSLHIDIRHLAVAATPTPPADLPPVGTQAQPAPIGSPSASPPAPILPVATPGKP